MRYLLTAIIAAVISGLIVGQLFRAAFENQIEKRIEAAVASSTLQALKTVQENQTPTATSTKKQFKGPSGQPGIIGPSGPPPNY